MIKLANGEFISEDVFYTWSAIKQRAHLDPDYIPRMRGQNTGLVRSAEYKSKMSQVKQGHTGLTGSANGMAKKIMTPDGLFDTLGLYCRHIDRTYNVVYRRMKREPNLYYFVKSGSA